MCPVGGHRAQNISHGPGFITPAEAVGDGPSDDTPPGRRRNRKKWGTQIRLRAQRHIPIGTFNLGKRPGGPRFPNPNAGGESFPPFALQVPIVTSIGISWLSPPPSPN